MNESVLIALIAALAGAVPTYLLSRRTPRRVVAEETSAATTAADAAADISGAAAQMVGIAVTEVKRLNENLAEIREEAHNARLAAEACEARVATLIKLDEQLQEMAHQLDRRNDQIDLLQIELEKRPTRDELIESVEKLRAQVAGLGHTPANGPTSPTP